MTLSMAFVGLEHQQPTIIETHLLYTRVNGWNRRFIISLRRSLTKLPYFMATSSDCSWQFTKDICQSLISQPTSLQFFEIEPTKLNKKSSNYVSLWVGFGVIANWHCCMLKILLSSSDEGTASARINTDPWTISVNKIATNGLACHPINWGYSSGIGDSLTLLSRRLAIDLQARNAF